LLLRKIEILDLESFGPIIHFNGPHCAPFFGIVEAVAALIDMERYDVDGADFYGLTLLALAALNGHEGVVKILLGKKEVDPNKPCDTGETLLSYAAQGGHEGVVKALLGKRGRPR